MPPSLPQQHPQPRTYQPGETVFVPFWILNDYLDTVHSDPFVKCTILSLQQTIGRGPAGEVEITVCNLDLGKPDLVAYFVPVTYLIARDELRNWARQIADWFLAYGVTNG